MSASAKTATNKIVYVGSHHNNQAISGSQGQQLIPTITSETCGSDRLSACTVVMPGARASKAHLHKHNDVIVIVVEGHAATLIGDNLEPVLHGQGEFIFIPAGVPHAAVNLSTSDRVVAFEVRTDPKFNEDVTLLPKLESKLAKVVAKLRKDFADRTLEVPKHWDVADIGPFRFADALQTGAETAPTIAPLPA